MTWRSWHCAVIVVVLAVLTSTALASGSLTNPPPALQMPTRVASLTFRLTNAFDILVTNPLAITAPPGESNRLFIVERAGRIIVITNLATPNRTMFLDVTRKVYGTSVEGGLLGLAFHPGYATNDQFYIFYTTAITNQGPFIFLDRLSQMSASATDPNIADTNSEVILLDQVDRSGAHNGGDIHFGLDGYLYVSLGDEGGANDEFQNSQRIDKNFFSGLLRIDVDNRPGSLAPNPHPANTNNATGTIHYRIPPDNPWVGATNFNGMPVDPANLRTEFYAVGLRNPWRFSFDPETGDLYCGDVGQDRYEEINFIRRGGNYGWNYREGYHGGPRSNAPVEAVFDEPLTEYGHAGVGASITGGVVYRGDRAPSFRGAYLFADCSMIGGFGYLWPNGMNRVERFSLGTLLRLTVAFGVDPRNGDVLLASFITNRIQRLVIEEERGFELPPTLFDTGAFTNLTLLTSHTEPLTPNAGLYRYDINVPSWEDGALRTHWFVRPSTNFIIHFSPTNPWITTDGAAWVQHFDLQLTNGVPSSARRVETRLLVNGQTGAYGVTYRWGDSLTNATLVPAGGLNESFVVHEGGTMRTQVWRYPARAECIGCHTRGHGGLSFETAQFNREVDFGDGPTNQLAAWSHAGFFSAPITNLNLLRSLAAATDESWSREWRVRSYLQANCVHCHRVGPNNNGFWTALSHVRLSAAGVIRGGLRNNEGDTNNRVVVPGSLEHSMLLHRISRQDHGKMPPLGATMLDTQAIALVSAWITNDLAGYQTLNEWHATHFPSATQTNGWLEADADFDGAGNFLEWLTGTDPNVSSDVWGKGEARVSGSTLQVLVPQIANRGFELQRTSHLNPPAWQPLDLRANRPFFSSTNRVSIVEDILTNTTSFYRVRVFEP